MGLPYQKEILAGSDNQCSACFKAILNYSFFLLLLLQSNVMNKQLNLAIAKLLEVIYCVSTHTCVAEVPEASRAGVQAAAMAT